MDDDLQPEKPKKLDPSVSLFLSLYLLLLAFFLVLNSISTLEERKATVVQDSLTSKFGPYYPTTYTDVFTSQYGDVVESAAPMNDVLTVFESHIPAVEVRLSQAGDVLELLMVPEALFLSDAPRVRPAHRQLIDRIVAALSNPVPGYVYTAELMMEGPSEDGFLPESETLRVARAGDFARLLLSRGLPPSILSVGVREGPIPIAALTFRIVPEGSERVRFVGEGPVDGG